MIIKTVSLEDYFNSKISNLNCRTDTRAYISSTLDKYKNTVPDFADKSLTLEYSEAKFNFSFQKYQELGDWLFFMESMYPEALKGASKEYYNSIAQSAYYKCYVMMNRSWILFEEIADKFPDLIIQMRVEMQAV